MCGVFVKAGEGDGGPKRFCVREECKIHKVGKPGTGDVRIPLETVYLSAPLKNNREVCTLFPRLDATGLEGDAVQYLRLHAPLRREDAVNIFALLEMMISVEEEIISQTRLIDIMLGYASGEYTAELAQSRVSTPASVAGIGVAFAPARFTPRSAGRASVAFSAMTEEGDEDVQTATSGAASLFSRKNSDEKVAFSTRLEDDEVTAETMYDPAQTQFLLTRVNDLTGGLVKLNASVGRIDNEQLLASAVVERLESRVEGVQESIARIDGRRIRDEAEVDRKFDEAATLVKESVQTQRTVNAECDGRLDRLEEPFRSDTGFPALFAKVGELAATVNGTIDGPPGAGIDERVTRAAGLSGVGTGSFGLNLGGTSTANANRSEKRVSELESEVDRLRTLVAGLADTVAGLSSTPTEGLGGLSVGSILDRLGALEERTQTGTSVTISNIVFNNERDVAEFVEKHVPHPNFGIICDLVILLQTLKVANPTTESTAGLLAQAQKVNMDPLETAIVGSYGVELPTIFDRTQGVLTSSNLHPLPSAKTYSDWSNAGTGLRDKVNAELKNSVISARKRIADARMTATAVMVFRDLVSNSASQWTSLTAFMDQQVAIMIGQYGLMEEEAWALVGKTVRQIFVKMREKRVSGENVVTSLTSKREQFASVLWASLQGHALMSEYQRDEYYGHHSLAAITAEHMLKHRVSPREFNSLRDRVATMGTVQDGLGVDVDKCLEKAGLQSARKKRK